MQGTLSIVLHRFLCYFAFWKLMTTISRILRPKSYLSPHVAYPREGSHSSSLFAASSTGIAFDACAAFSRQGSHYCDKCRILSARVFCYSVERFKQGYKPYVQCKVRFLLYCIDFCAILHSEGLWQPIRRLLRQKSYVSPKVAFPRQGSHSSQLLTAFSTGVAFKRLRGVFLTGVAF